MHLPPVRSSGATQALVPFNHLGALHDDLVALICERLPKKSTAYLMSTDKHFYEVIAHNSFLWLPALKRFYPSLYTVYQPNFKVETPYAVFQAMGMQIQDEIPNNIRSLRYRIVSIQPFQGNCRFIKEREGILYLIGDVAVNSCKRMSGEMLPSINLQNQSGSRVKAVHCCFPLMITHFADDLLRCVNVETGSVSEISNDCLGMRVRDRELFFFTTDDFEIWDLSTETVEKREEVHLLRECSSGLFDVYEDVIFYGDDDGCVVIQTLEERSEQSLSENINAFPFHPTRFSNDWIPENITINGLKVEGDRLVVFFHSGPIHKTPIPTYEQGCCVVDLKTPQCAVHYGTCIPCTEQSRIKEIQIQGDLLYYIYEGVADHGKSVLHVCKINCEDQEIKVDLASSSKIQADSFQVRGLSCLICYGADLNRVGKKLNTGKITELSLGASCHSEWPKSQIDATLEILREMEIAVRQNQKGWLQELKQRLPLFQDPFNAFSLRYSGSQEPCLKAIERIKVFCLIHALFHAIHNEDSDEMVLLLDAMGPVVSDLWDLIHKTYRREAPFNAEAIKHAFCSFDFSDNVPPEFAYKAKIVSLARVSELLLSRWGTQLFSVPALGLYCEQDYEAAGIEPVLVTDTRSRQLFQPLADLLESIDLWEISLLMDQENLQFSVKNAAGYLQLLVSYADRVLLYYKHIEQSLNYLPLLESLESRWQDKMLSESIGVYPSSWEGFQSHAQTLRNSFDFHFQNEETLQLFLSSPEGFQWVEEVDTLIKDFKAFMRNEILKKWKEASAAKKAAGSVVFYHREENFSLWLIFDLSNNPYLYRFFLHLLNTPH